MSRTSLLIGMALSCALSALATDATTPGTPTSPYPTVVNLAINWPITGDDNLNGVVNVRYREQGQTDYKQGMPLRRIAAGNNQGFSWANRHSGSIFDLKPATTYEIELTLTDPDGGGTVQNITATTRAVPYAAANSTVVNVADNAAFTNAANNAQPGQILLLGNGHYNTFTFGKDGTAALPIVIRAANPGLAIIDGDVRLDGRSYVYVEGLTVNGQIKFNGGDSLVIRRCTVNAVNDGIVTKTASQNCYIADNTVIGTDVWDDPHVGANGANLSEGIEVTGPGHVICFNTVRNFHDCLSTIEDSGAVNQVCIDFYNNDVQVGCDDGIEADFAMDNCRIMRNRLTNCFMGLSSQPGLGGPTYFIRNVMYNLGYSPLKPFRGSIGDIFIHNTVVKSGDGIYTPAGVTWSNALFRNNLIIGGPPGGTYGGFSNGTGLAANLTYIDASDDFNYDGFGAIGASFQGKIGSVNFTDLASLRANTTEKNAVQVDLSVFNATISLPGGLFPELAVPDLRLKAGSAAVDAGLAIPNINDGFAGSAPDLGAYEAGAALPTYGSRAVGVDESTAFQVPAAPTNLIATGATASRVDLSWTDASSNESKFELERSGDGGTTFSLITSPAANATTYADNGLAAATTYNYRVRAVSDAGPSAYSNVASATTQSSGGDGGGGGGGGGGGSGVDTDGDGIPDAMDSDDDNDGFSDADEIAAGTNPLDANSRPSVTKILFTLLKLQGAVKFTLTGKDGCLISGILPSLPALFDPASKAIVFNVGGASSAFTLDSKGRGKSAAGNVALKLKPSKRNKTTKKVEFLGGNVAFSARLKAGTWSDDWADEGVDSKADAKKAPRTFVVDVTLNSQFYTATAVASYSGKAEKNGKFSFSQKVKK